MADWADLAAELDRWGAAGRTASFWWRDDDAGPDDDAIVGLLDQRRRLDVPLALAVVPAWLAPPTVRRVLGDAGAAVLQHGWDHRNNAAEGVKRTELVDGLVSLGDDLVHGRAILENAFGGRFAAIVVPPWNRIGPGIRTRLAGLGFAGLSAHGPRSAARIDGLHVANVHVDIMDWRTRAFAGEAAALAQVVAHLAARREGRADGAEATGLMTHHRVRDTSAAAFVDRLVTTVRDHGAARWLAAGHLFGTGRAAA